MKEFFYDKETGELNKGKVAVAVVVVIAVLGTLAQYAS